ncbi:hypothetical protein [Symbioplanes lichenis]|uniref:hypothetical protein n=1 Tax=Symbioplanes lichenis TaxID=1629072 RepID=UPI0027388FE1|nr:hypothetical protein [Actinoplanes lichenis]
MTVRDERLRLADRSRDITVRSARPVPLDPPRNAGELPRYLRALRRLADADDLAAAYAGCTLARDVAAREGDQAGLATVYSQRSSVARRLGELPAALRDAEAAAALPPLPPGAAALLTSRRVAVHLDRGEIERAEQLMSDAELPDEPEYLLLRYVRGRLHLEAGRPGEALADLYRCGERLAVRGSDHPAVLPWRSAAAEVLAQLGAGEAAERLLGEEIALTRRHGLASALGRALRVQGRVTGGTAAAEEAVRVLHGTPRRFELATALVDLGALLNAARRRPQARRILRDGLELAQKCGSPALVERAQQLVRGRTNR